MEKLAMFKRHYRTAALVFLSLAAGSAAADAAETGINTTPDSSKHTIAYRYDPHRPVYGYREPHDYAGPQAGYGWYGYQWDPYTWSTGNGYY